METIQQELPLFNFESNTVPENKFIAPALEVLVATNPAIEKAETSKGELSKSLKASLNNLFPEQQYKDKDLQRARVVLGETAENINEDQLKEIVTEAQILAMAWLDDFERELFDGLTLQELLHEKGGL